MNSKSTFFQLFQTIPIIFMFERVIGGREADRTLEKPKIEQNVTPSIIYNIFEYSKFEFISNQNRIPPSPRYPLIYTISGKPELRLSKLFFRISELRSDKTIVIKSTYIQSTSMYLCNFTILKVAPITVELALFP